jgi:hypothetical protein
MESKSKNSGLLKINNVRGCEPDFHRMPMFPAQNLASPVACNGDDNESQRP